MSSPKRPKRQPSRNRVRQRTKQLRRTINAMDYVASGTLHIRTKVCGRKNCRCAREPDARHGPYHEWSRRQDGQLLHSIVSPEQAQILVLAIDNHKQILALLALWQRETVKEVLDGENA